MNKYIIVARHADVYDNPGGARCLYGNLPGFWLSQLGIRQARAARDYLGEQFGRPGVVICSPLERTRQTAEIMMEGFPGDKPQIVLDSRLEDIGVGPWQGIVTRKDWTDHRQRYWELQLGADGSNGLESPAQTQNRIVSAFFEHIQAFSDQSILLVSHGDVLCFLMQHLAGEELEPLVTYKRGVNKATLFEIKLDGEPRITKLYEPEEYGTVYPHQQLHGAG